MPEFSTTFLQGLDLLNKGKYFEAHEVIEAAWRTEPDEIRNLYQGILQVAVVYFHITNHNYKGARKVIKRAISNLSSFTENAMIDIPEIIRNLKNIDSRLEMIGSDRIGEINPALLKSIKLHL